MESSNGRHLTSCTVGVAIFLIISFDDTDKWQLEWDSHLIMIHSFLFLFSSITVRRRITATLSPRRIVAAALSPLPLPAALQTCQVGPWRDGELIECDSGATTTSQPQRQAESNMPTVEFLWITCRCPLLLINVVLEWPHTLDVGTKAFLTILDTCIKVFHFNLKVFFENIVFPAFDFSCHNQIEHKLFLGTLKVLNAGSDMHGSYVLCRKTGS